MLDIWNLRTCQIVMGKSRGIFLSRCLAESSVFLTKQHLDCCQAFLKGISKV